MPNQTVLEGTGEELLSHLERHPHERFRLIALEGPTDSCDSISGALPRASILGKYADVPGGSEEFARQKQAEIDLEDRVRK